MMLNSTIFSHSKKPIECGITLLLGSLHSLPLTNARLLAAVYHIGLVYSKNIITSRSSDVCKGTRNSSPYPAAIDWPSKNITKSVDTINVLVATINLLKMSSNYLPLSIAWFLTAEDRFRTVHPLDVAIARCRHVLETSWDGFPCATSVHGSLEDLIKSVHSPHFTISNIYLH